MRYAFQININDEYTKRRFKRNLAVRLNNSICAEFCSKLWFESDCVFVILLSHDDFESDYPDTKSLKQSLLKVSLKK